MKRKATLCNKPLRLDWSGRQHHLAEYIADNQPAFYFSKDLSDFFEEVPCYNHKFCSTYDTVHPG
ncbi:hypothetical protein DFP95_12438 [Cohnella lupini]|uniref:Uncharacterized protein n=1 Tax=Cohnella lupini TaxID=1294267 RepID=A0A3D9HYC2_9BACL|nr:hypothetical protein DFP95_12438 [Cohnella lupini]